MKHIFKTSAVALAVGTAMVAPAANADISITGSVRAGLVADDSADEDFALRSVGSRFIMSASEDIGGGLTGIGRIEVGIQPDNTSGGGRTAASGRGGGFDRTRQIWGGISGGFGTVKIGAQYSAFYDTVTGKGDIAWWGSCFLEFGCAREPAVLKYSGKAGGLGFTASIEGNEQGSDSGGTAETIEEFEAGISYNFGSVGLGAAVAVDEDGVNSGTLIGLSATGSFSGVNLSLVLQSADEEFADDAEANEVVTFTAAYNGFYGLLTSRDTSNDTLTNLTLGYYWSIAKKTAMYFEFQTLGNDDDDNNIVRAVFRRDFTIVGG